ncbi:MAG: hypothetical protein IVW57_18175 [Ktedonobacterales bacterium]|nr:hypothetical protein [Ktedonobacterales bacterium]
MGTGTTITCACGSRGFIVIDAATGQRMDLKAYYATMRQRTIDPTDLTRHDPLDMSRLRLVCANPQCQRVLS